MNRVLSFLRQRPVLSLLGTAAIASLCGILLLGLPGAILFQTFLLLTARPSQAIKPDAAWPIALLISLLWPWGVPAGYVVASRFLSDRKREMRCRFTFLFEALWLFALCFCFLLLGA